MDQIATRNILEAALLAANGSVSLDKLAELFSARGVDADRGELKAALAVLAEDYADREIELKETASGYRIQVKSSVRDWLQPLFEERAPRYTRALLETLALIAYRQPITRAEIEEIRGVAVSTNIVRTLFERGWVRVVGHREVPGKPSMLGTTREFLDYFGLKRLEDLPPLAELRDIGPGSDPQSDFIDELAGLIDEADRAGVEIAVAEEMAEPSNLPHSDTSTAADEGSDDGTSDIHAATGDAEPENTEPENTEPENTKTDDPESEEPESDGKVIPFHQSEA